MAQSRIVTDVDCAVADVADVAGPVVDSPCHIGPPVWQVGVVWEVPAGHQSSAVADEVVAAPAMCVVEPRVLAEGAAAWVNHRLPQIKLCLLASEPDLVEEEGQVEVLQWSAGPVMVSAAVLK